VSMQQLCVSEGGCIDRVDCLYIACSTDHTADSAAQQLCLFDYL